MEADTAPTSATPTSPVQNTELGETEAGETDSTTSAEDGAQENLDALLRDLKDLDQGESAGSANMGSASPPTTTPPAATTTATTTTTTPTTSNSPAPAKTSSLSPSQNVQKESVFVRLANRIKALERNMSLSSQYLEELSRRYKKQVEEMQKAFNRTLQAVHEASRIGEEREARRQEEMQQLQHQLLQLSESLENLVAERDSWLNRLYVVAQHLILICVEILVFVLLMYFCRRLPETSRAFSEEQSRKSTVGTKGRKTSRPTMKRRKSVEGVSGHESPRTRNRRPSEEALRIAGSYQDLLITEPGVSEIDGYVNIPKGDTRRRRRKRKDLLLRSASIRLPVRHSEPLMDVAEEQKNVPNRRASSLELGVWWGSSNGVSVEEEDERAEHKNPHVVPHYQQSSLDPLHSDCSTLPVIESVSPHIASSEGDSHQSKDGIRRQSGADNASASQIKQRSASDTISPLPHNNGLVRSNILGSTIQRQLSSPVFMRTATSIRNSRLGSPSVEPSPPAKLKSDNWEWYSTHHGLDKSSQLNKVTCSVSCPGSGTGDPNQRQNGHSAADDTRRCSNASSSASSTSNISERVSHKDSGKKGPSSLKKMVKKFF